MVKGRRMFQPSKDTVLHRWAFNLGPQRDALACLGHLGDDAIFKPFPPGDEPSWLEALAVLLAHNDHITLDDVMAELRSRVNLPQPMSVRRKRT